MIFFRIDWFDLLAVTGTLKVLLQDHSSKALILWCSAFFIVQISHSHMTTTQAFVIIVMPLLFNMLSKFFIVFLPRSKYIFISWLQLPYCVFGAQENEIYHFFHLSPYICHEVMGADAMIFVFSSFVIFFHFPLSPSSRGSLFPLYFLPLKWYHLHIWGFCYFSWKSWFQLVSQMIFQI